MILWGAMFLSLSCYDNVRKSETQLAAEFSGRRIDLDELVEMASHDGLDAIHAKAKWTTKPPMAAQREAQYRARLQRVGGYWMSQMRSGWFKIPVRRSGLWTAMQWCGYVHVSGAPESVPSEFNGLSLRPLADNWFAYCQR